MRYKIASTTYSKSVSCLRVFWRTSWFLVSYFSNIIPGQSTNFTWLSNFTYFKFLVQPGMDDTSQVFDLFKLFITLLFPTLGYPISPTVTALVEPSPSTLDNCFMSCIKWSGPTALLLLIISSATYEWFATDFLYIVLEDKCEFWFCKFALNSTTGYSLRR